MIKHIFDTVFSLVLKKYSKIDKENNIYLMCKDVILYGYVYASADGRIFFRALQNNICEQYNSEPFQLCKLYNRYGIVFYERFFVIPKKALKQYQIDLSKIN